MGGGHGPNPKIGVFSGGWGNFGSPTPQRGVTSYSLSANRQNPLAGAFHNAVFNTWRRFRGQVLYVAPPFIAAYSIMSWATERNEYLNSKTGRLLEPAED